MAGKNTPMWRQAFNKAERAVGEPLEKAIDTRQFADAMSLGAKVRKTVQRQIYGAVNKTLHFWGLSTLKDTREISRQLNRVQGQLRELSTQLEYLEEREQAREAEDATRHVPPPAPFARADRQQPAAADEDAAAAAKVAKKAPAAKKPSPAAKSAPSVKKSAPAVKKSSPAKRSAPVRKSAPAPTPTDAVQETGDRPRKTPADSNTPEPTDSTTPDPSRSGGTDTAAPQQVSDSPRPAGELTTGRPDSTQGA